MEVELENWAFVSSLHLIIMERYASKCKPYLKLLLINRKYHILQSTSDLRVFTQYINIICSWQIIMVTIESRCSRKTNNEIPSFGTYQDVQMANSNKKFIGTRIGRPTANSIKNILGLPVISGVTVGGLGGALPPPFYNSCPPPHLWKMIFPRSE